MRREAKRTGVFTRRALLVAGGQVAALGFLGAKLYQVQVIEGDRYATLAETNRISARLIAPPRGRLLDRFGTVVAGNKLNWRALLIAEQTEDVGTTLYNFSRIVPLAEHERARIERDLRRHRRFIPVTVREFLSWEDMARIEVNAPDLPGILVDVGTTRQYPLGPTLAHVVGYVAPPNENDVADDPMLALPGIRVGRAGMERTHDTNLRGRAGAVQLEVNAVGRVIRELDRQEGTPGQDVALTIDAELQKSVLQRLGEESASAVVMDARNGEVLAMATNPSFDPSLFNSGISQAQWVQWTNNRRAPLINKAAAGLYAPGSTYKMVVALAGLEAKAITASDRVNCPGYLDYGDRRYHCWSKGGHGMLDLHGALKHSCDVFFYEVARRTGIDRIAAMSNRFGLGTKLGIDLPGARQGFVPTRAWRTAQGKAWNIGDTIVCGIGQGYLQLTPLSLATMAARLATGRAVEPHLTRSIGGVVQSGARSEDWPSLGVPERALHAVREGMWAVVNEPQGTAPLARLPIQGVQMAGKTGSVQIRNVSREQRERGYKSENLPWELRPHALFVAFAPYDAPRYALALVVEHGNAGAQAAAPIARDIMTDVLTRDPAGRNEPPGQRLADRR
ncbi:penicillin-binding protein 2 [Limobrevibacterium gyesilva]|uniref:Penicillin-binding protein 2 n=1 Tax=Limobrevibacterium gyesilva TaxID=2991712 RepID=A0AA41YK87_9PROT|nr:penicillin-binding protein 2 [Limobrevibacterium gyesilva]MCW3474819.1 penicillin-binding protein 2 [Limobrevibacterium gyesilva]